MPTFLLSPIASGLASPAWKLSRYKGSCLVVAPDAEAARRYANGAFLLPLESAVPALHTSGRPWTDPDLVSVQITDISPDTVGLNGSVKSID